MIKCEIFTSYVGQFSTSILDYDKKVKNFIEQLSIDGHTFISSQVSIMGETHGMIRTQIIYQENQTREVIFEKTSS